MTDRTTPHVVPAGAGHDYDWAQDHVFVKTPVELTEGRVTVVEDCLKPGFRLPRHHHRRTVEIFYILEGAVRFTFDDSGVVATRGMTITVPPRVPHQVLCVEGGRLITMFTPGGFDNYLAELSALSPAELSDLDEMRALSERYDTWTES